MIFIYKSITEYINSDIIKGKLLPGQFSSGDSFFFESKNLLHVALLIIQISHLRRLRGKPCMLRFEFKLEKWKLSLVNIICPGAYRLKYIFNDHPEICEITIDTKLIEFFIFQIRIRFKIVKKIFIFISKCPRMNFDTIWVCGWN